MIRMTRTLLGLTAALGFCFAIAGCGGGGDEDYGDAPDKRPPPAQPRQAPGPAGGPTADDSGGG